MNERSPQNNRMAPDKGVGPGATPDGAGSRATAAQGVAVEHLARRVISVLAGRIRQHGPAVERIDDAQLDHFSQTLRDNGNGNGND